MQLEIRQLWGKFVNSLQETLLAKCDIDGGLDPIDGGIYSHLSFPLQGCVPLAPHIRSRNSTKHHSQHVNRQGHWSPPEVGTLKINTDGSSQGNPGPACIGGVGHDSSGDIQFLFSIYKGNQNNNLMEALAILVAVEQCCQRGWKRIICESDSQVVVNLLHSRSLVHVDSHLALVIQ